MSTQLFRTLIKGLTLLFILASLSACSLQPENDILAEYQQQRYPKDAGQYLSLADTYTSPEREAHLLMATGRLLDDGMIRRAKQILQTLRKTTLSRELRNQYFVLQAKLALLRKRPRTALRRLAQVKEVAQLDPAWQTDYHTLLAKAYLQKKDTLNSIKQRIKLEKLLQGPALSKNRKRLYQTLQSLPLEKLQALLDNRQKLLGNAENFGEDLESSFAQDKLNNGPFRGWLELAYLTKKYQDNAQRLLSVLAQWQLSYPQHTAQKLLPSSIADTTKTLQPTPQHIALLLPLSGRLATAGKTVRNGFMTAFYRNKRRQPQSSVRVYDSHQGNIAEIYQKAVANGADIVVGPLSKTKTQELSRSHLAKIPTLTLNYLNHSTSNKNLYQFGISPLDEAKQIAYRARDAGYHRALLIVPQGRWGQDIAQTFTHQWQAVGGRVISEFNYNPSENFKPAIREFLNIAASQARARYVRRSLHKKIKFTPRRRQDIDMIFLVATPKVARQVRPMLNYFYAGNIPVYATSSVYAGTPAPRKDLDINGVIFCDMPWVFNPKSRAKRHTRLYALGLDAYRLTQSLELLTLLPKLGLNGATGRLFLKDQKIVRNLQWAQFKHGYARLL